MIVETAAKIRQAILGLVTVLVVALPLQAHATDVEAPTLELATTPASPTFDLDVRLRGVARDTGGSAALVNQLFDIAGTSVDSLGWAYYGFRNIAALEVVDGRLVLRPNGEHRWWNDDHGFHMYRLLEGGFAFTTHVRVTGQTRQSGEWASAGFLIREPPPASPAPPCDVDATDFVATFENDGAQFPRGCSDCELFGVRGGNYRTAQFGVQVNGTGFDAIVNTDTELQFFDMRADDDPEPYLQIVGDGPTLRFMASTDGVTYETRFETANTLTGPVQFIGLPRPFVLRASVSDGSCSYDDSSVSVDEPRISYGAAIAILPPSYQVDPVVASVLTIDGNSNGSALYPHPSAEAFLRGCRIGDQIRTYYRATTEDEWSFIAEETVPLSERVAVGMVVDDNKQPPTIQAEYDSVSIHEIATMDECLVVPDQAGGGTGIQDVEVIAEALGVTLSADPDAGGNFDVEVPLEVGENRLELVAVDGVGNRSEPVAVEVLRELTATPTVTIDSPFGNIDTLDEAIEISGRVMTTLPVEDISIRLGELRAFPQASDDEGVYDYSFDVPLVMGPNVFDVAVFSPYGSDRATTTVHRADPAELQSESTSPVIELPFGATELLVRQSEYVLSGVVRAPGCVGGVDVNGLAPDELQDVEPGVVSFSTLIGLSANETFPVEIVATGCDGAQTAVSLSFIRDEQSPEVHLSAPLGQGPHSVLSNPIRVAGTVADVNLAGASIGGELLRLVPTTTDGEWTFESQVFLQRGVPTPISVTAWDRSGRQTTVSTSVQLDQSVSLELLRPRDGDFIGLENGVSEFGFEAVVRGANSSDRLVTSLDGGSAHAQATGAGTHSGTVAVPSAGEHTLLVRVENASGTTLAQTEVDLQTGASSDVPVRVLRFDPQADAASVESNVPLTVYFNRPLDPALVQIRVRETVHGFVYQTPNSSDLLHHSVLERVRVDRDAAPVDGTTQNLPGNRTFAFYPDNAWTYGSSVSVEVVYDEAQVATSRFATRPLPTLVHGFVLTEAGQPLENVRVELPELGYEGVTNANGLFTFGWGWPADREIPGGIHHIVFNDGAADPRLGALEGWIQVEEQNVNGGNRFRLDPVKPSATFVQIEGGGTFSFGARMDLDLAGAEVTFADGASRGVVSPRMTTFEGTGYRSDLVEVPLFAIRVEPGQVGVAGDVGVEVGLPAFEGKYEYIDRLSRLAGGETPLLLLYGLNPATLRLNPVGLLEIETESLTAVTRRPVSHLRRLDVLAVGTLPRQVRETAEGYLDGHISFEELIDELAAVL